MADAVELPQKRFEVLFIDEIAQSHDYGETHVVFGLRVKIGLYELPHRLPLGGAEPPAEAVADGPVVDLGYKAGHVCELFGGFAPGIADHQPLQHPLFEIEILGFGQICAPVPGGDLLGDAAQYGQAYAQHVFDARHQRRGEFHVFRLGEFEQLFTQRHRLPNLGVMPMKKETLSRGMGRESTDSYSSLSRLWMQPLSENDAHLQSSPFSSERSLMK